MNGATTDGDRDDDTDDDYFGSDDADDAQSGKRHHGVSGFELGDLADRTVAQLHDLDEKVNAMKQHKSDDSETLGDKIIKLALPSLAGLVAGKVFQMLWDRFSPTAKAKRAGKGDVDEGLVDDDVERGLWASLVFTAMSAAFSAVISLLSDRGSNAFVAHRQHKRAQRS